jgi:tetratricopeptide (TPR) repeat protein
MQPDVLSRISDAIVDAGDATGALNLGWYAYNFEQVTIAASWFREALEFDPSSEGAAYGLIVASNRLRDRATIQEMKERFGGISPRIAQFGRPGAPTAAPMSFAPDSSDLSGMIHNAVVRGDARSAVASSLVLVVEATLEQRAAGQSCPSYVPPGTLSAQSALQRGWCLLSLERASEAVEAFNRALQTTSTSTRTDAAYGLTLSYIRLNLVNEAAVAAALAPQTETRVAEMQIGILTATAVAFYDIGRYREALEALNRRSRLAPEQNDLLTLRAWSYYHLGHRREAEQLFRALAATGHPDAAAGLVALGVEQF